MQDLKFILTEESKNEEDLKRRKDLKSDILRVSGGIPSIFPYNKENTKSSESTKKWAWSEFHNSARNDNLQLKHWQRVEDIKKDYEYAQYNKKINVVNIKKDEFEQFSNELDPSWSWEETEYFWDLCRSYDLRFIIIQDRYNFSGKDRSVEELKERYYSLCKKILENRKQFDHPILKSGYCYEQEVKRRACLERIINKSTEQQKLENELIQQSNDIKEKQEKLAKMEAFDNKLPKQIDDQDIAEGTFEDYIRNKQSVNSFTYLRSYKINHPVPINEKIQKKIEIMLKEMITEKPIPTERIENAIDILKNNLIIMVSLKKHLEKKLKEKKKLENTLADIENKANKNKSSQNNIIVTTDPSNKLSLGLKKEKKKGLVLNSSSGLKLSMNKKKTNFEEESKTENSSNRKQKKKFDLSLVSME